MDRWIDRYSGILYHKYYCTGIFSWFISIVVVVTILECGVNFPLILYCLSAFAEWVSQLKKPWWHFKNTHITQSHIVRGLIHTPNHITQHVWRFSARGGWLEQHPASLPKLWSKTEGPMMRGSWPDGTAEGPSTTPRSTQCFSLSFFLAVFVFFLPHQQARSSEEGHRRGRWFVSTICSLFSQTVSGGE